MPGPEPVPASKVLEAVKTGVAAHEAKAKRSLVEKLVEVLGKVERVAKRGTNETQRYKYATEADIVEEVRGHLAEVGVLLIPSVTKLEWRVIEGRNGPINIATVFMTFTFKDGAEEIGVPVVGEGMDSGDKNVYKAMTGALKYALKQTFLIPTGDDPEKDDAPPESPPRRQQPKAEATPAKPAESPKPGATLGLEDRRKVWATCKDLWPDDANAKFTAFLKKHGVSRSEDLPLSPEKDGEETRCWTYLNELAEMKRLEEEAEKNGAR